MRPGVTALRSIAALLGACGVILGAFGAHALRDGFSATQLGLWQTAVSYLFWHVLAALLALQWDARVQPVSGRAAAVLFLSGSALFSGSLFALALAAPRWIGVLTPIGGLALISGWLALAWAFARSNRAARPDHRGVNVI